jgi:hypothetical protein
MSITKQVVHAIAFYVERWDLLLLMGALTLSAQSIYVCIRYLLYTVTAFDAQASGREDT